MTDHPFGWFSLLPPLVAIVLAIVTRRILISLFLGIFVGALVLSGGRPWPALTATLQEHLWATLIDEEKLHVFAFTILMGAMVGMVNRGGGMRGMVQAVTPWAANRRRGQIVTWLLGLFVFFDDYANTMLLGNTLRPLADRLRISREKLAYLVDSTAAPVSGLALVSTWVAGEIGYVQDGLNKISADESFTALRLFVGSIPYRFYVLWALLLVPMIGWMRRDFGPMYAAEQRAWRGEPPERPSMIGESDLTQPAAETPGRWYNAVIPIGVTVLAIVWLLYESGRSSLGDAGDRSLMEIFGEADAYGSLLWGALAGAFVAAVLIGAQRLISGTELVRAAGAGARMMCPALAILWFASALSAMTGNAPSAADAHDLEISEASALASADGVLESGGDPSVAASALADAGIAPQDAVARFQQADIPRATAVDALESAGYPADDVRRAWAEIEGETSADDTAASDPAYGGGEVDYTYQSYRLYTGAYLGRILEGNLPAPLLPTLVFVLSAAVAFSTGTSWGTMGIIMPLALPLTWGVLQAEGGITPDHPILLGSVGGVLAGAIFGDHCSPISDTTVLSSQSSGCDHVAHVWTQLPYALLVGVTSVVLGTLPIGYGVPVWITLPIGFVALIVFVRIVGRRADLETTEE